ncbi:MAG TPA: electron transfer flavoprotein subunit alpha/FixB family protein [Oligoflexia bacterium]|mgnify:CR=1 FL=1|nr:electron transfer flavoprotein subunit alpha/FixB family protein [Oligoflexia bacterium]HMP48902.1 electron transfer flavoprotein subunit alpha/FixB family protein [Oligoflexia bacterium]
MRTILAFIESTGEDVSKSSLAVFGAALQAKSNHGYGKLVVFLMGSSGIEKAATSLCDKGADAIIFMEDKSLDPYIAPVYADVLVEAAKEQSASLVLAAASSRGKDFMPRVAFSLDAAQASDVTGFGPNGIFIRPMYAGNIISEVELLSEVKVATIRQSAFDVPESSGKSVVPEKKSYLFSRPANTEFVSFDTVKSERPELGDAEVVISGGRALGSKENFEKVLFPLADKLNAALGASRAAVDAGFAPNDWQVGQTGKIVAPKLYIAIGISGAVQHLAGMKDSKVIVAINKDGDAPIFELADYGLVADLFQAVPELIEKIG